MKEFAEEIKKQAKGIGVDLNELQINQMYKYMNLMKK